MMKNRSVIGTAILIGLLVIFSIGLLLTQQRGSERPLRSDDDTSSEQRTYSADVQAQIAVADQYSEASYDWTNAMLNAALYSADHRLCGQAAELLETVQNTKGTDKVGLNIPVIKERIDANCEA